MKKFLETLGLLLIVVGCKSEVEPPQQWTFKEVLVLDDIHPIGIVAGDKEFYISDGDNNRVLKVDNKGKLLFEYKDLERPMHLDFGKIPDSLKKQNLTVPNNQALLIPEYGKDTIAIINENIRTYLPGIKDLDAPAAISVSGEYIAIADFYNHQILFYNGTEWKRYGKEGHDLGELYYPTDVQIFKDTLYIADAYNNRGQVFTMEGQPIRTFGESQGLNAATGIFVTEKNIYLTDFENNRVLNFDDSFNILQELSSSIDKPTDILKHKNLLYITNYKRGELVIFESDKK